MAGTHRVLLVGAALLAAPPSVAQGQQAPGAVRSTPVPIQDLHPRAARPPAVLAPEPQDAGPVRCEREADCLRSLKGIAVRQGETLRLKLAGGQWKTVRSNKKACDRDEAAKCVTRELRAYLPAQNVYVVEWTTSADGGAEVISAVTGETETIDTLPEFSPSGQWFVSVDPDELNERHYDIGIWSVAGGEVTPELVYVRDAGAYEAWEFKGWDGDNRIRLRLSRPNTQPVDTEAVLTETGWKLKKPSPPGGTTGTGWQGLTEAR